jgi:hypothetical protein
MTKTVKKGSKGTKNPFAPRERGGTASNAPRSAKVEKAKGEKNIKKGSKKGKKK